MRADFGLTNMKSKLKSRTPAFDVLYLVEPDIVGQSRGIYFLTIFSAGTVFWVKLRKSAKKRFKPEKKGSIFDSDFQKYWPRGHEKNGFSIFGLVHVDVKSPEDSECDLIFSNCWYNSGQKHGFMTNYHILESIEIYPNLAVNYHFWPLLREKFEKIRSDLGSSCNFTSTCTKPKIEKQFLPWFRAQYF